ncbi:TlpA disulfide reductase family protein [Sulfurimonas sp.]|jgi:thiol-disulfide isomerase/thioredoxin|uniref:TlpA family protein disulfide reductase n=2 Tax=Sulfurimonas TaxID=202746 RepID=UPI0025F40D06|nr:TlpA disulfide reductase family protein [Sulfurimonas sp.]
MQKIILKGIKTMFSAKLISSLLTLTLLLSACSDSEDANSLLSTNEYILTSLDKQEYIVTKTASGFDVKQAKDKVIILNIFATWCPPCKAEASHLTSLQKKYKDDLLILGISVEDDIADAKLVQFAKDYNAKYALVNSPENSRIINAVATELKIGRNFGIPLMAMYKNGKLVNYYQGATEEEFIESDIKKALGH